MSVDGHWTVRFASVAGPNVQRESGGVATFHAGKIVGGDTWAYYVGAYKLDGRKMTIRVDVKIHFTEGGESIMGGPLVPYTFVGTGDFREDGNRIDVQVNVEGQESLVLVGLLTKVAEFR